MDIKQCPHWWIMGRSIDHLMDLSCHSIPPA
uniref:Uncharacterized protein n=1 Tax=Rhizophora mucronata TaxID=61149 RepID=A0A2P2NSJ4_RHIMU